MTAPKDKQLQVGEAGSKMQMEFDRDQGLAEQYLAEANAKNLYELYQARCKQLAAFGETLCTMADMYAGKKDSPFLSANDMPSAIAAMERVALAAIDLAKATTVKGEFAWAPPSTPK